jgi:serine/threonine protein kinase
LKPENILLFGKSLTAKISDFGTSKVVQTMKSNTHVSGTAQYSAPELMEVGSTFGVSVDVYSVTVIFYELFSGRVPFPGTQLQITRCQFQQHFTRGFFLLKFCAKLTCAYILGLYLFAARILAQKLLLKCW